MSEAFVQSHGIDWITASKKYDSAAYDDKGLSDDEWALAFATAIAAEWGWQGKALAQTNQAAFYPHCYLVEEIGAMIQVSDNLRVQGARVIVSGASVSRLFDAVMTLQGALEWGWKITRLDYRWDVVDAGERPEELMAIWKLWSKGNKIDLKIGFHESNGQTWELGARTSMLWSKIYEKGKERGEKTDKLRIELEFKEGHAMLISQSVVGGRHKEICGVALMRYEGISRTNVYKALNRFCGEAQPIPLESKRVQTNTEKWLHNTVRSAFLKFARVHSQEAREWLDNLQNSLNAIEKGRGQE